jgi:hypothetical protein
MLTNGVCRNKIHNYWSQQVEKVAVAPPPRSSLVQDMKVVFEVWVADESTGADLAHREEV